MSVITDCIIEHDLKYVLASTCEFPCIQAYTPELYDCEYLKKVSDFNLIMKAKIKMPWPFYHRDMAISIGLTHDYTNNACVSLSKTLDAGTTYFGYTIPPEEPNVIVREDI